jgi:hypothetical protein
MLCRYLTHIVVPVVLLDLKEIGCEDVDYIHVDQDRGQGWTFVNAVMSLWVPQKTGTFLNSWVT